MMTYFLKNGNITETKPIDALQYRVVAKKFESEDSSQASRYYIALVNNSLYDTKRVSDREARTYFNGYKQVSPEAFNHYINYITKSDYPVGIKSIQRMCE